MLRTLTLNALYMDKLEYKHRTASRINNTKAPVFWNGILSELNRKFLKRIRNVAIRFILAFYIHVMIAGPYPENFWGHRFLRW